MADIDAVFARLTNDSGFADALRTDPATALREYRLSADDLTRLEQALSPSHHITQVAATGWRANKILAITAGVAAATAAIGVGVGWATANDGGATRLRYDRVDVRDCSTSTAPGDVSGSLHRGDHVYVIGKSGPTWLVVRHPADPGRAGWVAANDLIPDGDTSALPELTCSQAEAVAEQQPTVTTTPESTTSTTTDSTTTTAPIDTTLPATTVPATAPPVLTTPPTVPPTTPITTPPDTTPPTVAIVPDRTYLYSEATLLPCRDEDSLDLTVTLTDDRGAATVVSGTWRVSGGSNQSGALVSLGGGRYRVPTTYSNHFGSLPLEIRVVARDAAGNETTQTATVQFLQQADTCIG